MKLKIIIASLGVLLLTGIIYLENTDSPAVGFPIIASKIEQPENTISENTANTKSPTTTANTTSPVNTTSSSNTGNTDSRITLPNFSFQKLIFPAVSDNSFAFDTQKIASLTTKSLIIHFWSSWCNVCGTEWPEMIKFANKNPDTTILAISIDDSKSKFTESMSQLNTKFQIASVPNIVFALDENKLVSVGIFNTEIVPENYFISVENDQYKIMSKSVGKVNWSELYKQG